MTPTRLDDYNARKAQAIFANRAYWNTALTNTQLDRLARELRIKHYRGAVSRDRIGDIARTPARSGGPQKFIVNLEARYQGRKTGTHWTAALFDGHNASYYDSFAAPPPREVLRHFDPIQVVSNAFRHQTMDTDVVYCGMLSLYVMYMFDYGPHAGDFVDTVLDVQGSWSASRA